MTRALTAAAYAALGAVLVWSRFAGLGRGYCCDEIRTIVAFVREGPHAILVGPYAPNNHELFSLAGWATSSLVGESEVAIRAWSAIPFVVGVAVVTTWLHVRLGALSGVLFLFFATLSPLLLDISWQARGYGLAFLAMSAMVVAALEAERTGKAWLVGAFCAAGLVGTWTFPHFALAFVTTGLVLSSDPRLRRPSIAGLSLSIVAIAAWYAPHVDDIAASSSQEYGAPIRAVWIVTSPFDQILVPALTVLDEAFVRPSAISLVWAAALAALMASSPLLRRRTPALVVSSGVVTTLIVFWLAGADVVPRFLSFLLVPLFMLLASGSASILERLSTRPAPARTVLALVTLGGAAVVAAPHLVSLPREPREAQAKAAALIGDSVTPTTPVLARMPYSNDLAFHLGRRVNGLESAEALASVCDQHVPIVYVDEPWRSPSADLPCLMRTGVRHRQLEQYARGGVIDVWFIPAAR